MPRGHAEGTRLIASAPQLRDVIHIAELHAVAVHAHASHTMNYTQKVVNRLRRIKEAVANGTVPAPKYPITEVSGSPSFTGAGSVYKEPQELIDELDGGEFIDVAGQRWELTLLPVFEPIDE